MEEEKRDQIIPGIFNYCDRWCERCVMTHRCHLYADEQETKRKHIESGEDPNDINIVLQEVKENFEKTILMIQKTAEEEGIDLETLPESDYIQPDPSGNPLYVLAQNYSRDSHHFLTKLYKILQEEGYDLAERVEIMPSPQEEVENLQDIGSDYEVISWYHTLIPAKVHRALSSKMEAEVNEDVELAQMDQEDADRSANIAYKGIVRSITALQKIYNWNSELKDDALHLMIQADRLRRGIDKEFPGHRSVKIIGFGDR